MNLKEFKCLSPEDQRDYYNKIKDKQVKHNELMRTRVEEDVKINTLMWQDFMARLEEMYTLSKEVVDNGSVGGKRVSEDEVLHIDSKIGLSVDEWINQILTFLMFKADCARLQEQTGWKLDEELLNESLTELEAKFEESKNLLESVMPKVVKYKDKKKSAKPYKKSGELSSSGESWAKVVEDYNNQTKDEHNNLLVIQSPKDNYLRVLDKYEEPNANSPLQVKEFLYLHGWKPVSMKYERDKDAMDEWVKSKPKRGAGKQDWDEWKADKPKDREIPQITINGDSGKTLCPSVEELAEDVPEVMALAEYSTLKHRIGILKGFKRDAYGGRIQACIGGLANTLRMQHRVYCNLPSTDKPYGNYIRDVLIADEGYILVGSDLSSLEDRLKNHFMLAHDPDFVAEMLADDYDPHISTALSAGLITQKEFDEFKEGIEAEHVVKARRVGKSTNYASVYGAGPATIARTADIPLEEATKAHGGYWKKNWSVKAIADEQVIIQTSRKERWLVNPFNGFLYSLRTDKDRFSTLIQGSGAFFFDCWLDEILTAQKQTFSKTTQTAQTHDDVVYCIKDHPKTVEWLYRTFNEALNKVNVKYKLRKQLDCDIQKGHKFSDIH